MTQTNYIHRDLANMLKRNKDGSYSTQAARHTILMQAANRLRELGFVNLSGQSLKTKHVDALVKSWLEENLSSGTIKNRLSHIRWWAEKINKQNIVARDNTHYGIENRRYVTNKDKSTSIEGKLAKIKDPLVVASLRLQEAFGLRREESIKFQPRWADLGDKIHLKDTWCKGGRPREVPITSNEQRELLDELKKMVGSGSLIPPDKRYIDQLNRFRGLCQRAGIENVHGLRHAYAQKRYKDLTGRDCPNKGGLKSKELSESQKKENMKARLTISRELGHNREEITAVYLGR